ncbi:MAG: 3'-5' exonuclease domain-containing protein 2 [Bacteroidales bacterium]|nr:3'-5' exonuclease domain-containing protein 2 [Porphyromonas sp.]MDD6934137.1 3'-5' exonuclease domain-containing protein 2 [Bacteroidales bacterium]MDY3101709.1 3'-5' exonuclease [Porphyromonas sp.]
METLEERISKEEVNELDRLAYFPGEIHLVETVQEAEFIFDELEKQTIVGIDTETKPCFERGEKPEVALIQIATLDDAYLIRVNKTGIPPRLKAFLANPNILKVGLSLRDDYKVIRRKAAIQPEGFVELQSLCPAYGIREQSLQRIYAILFDERISKSQRLTNWESEHLSYRQQAYAALDAYACLRIYNALMARPVPHPTRFAMLHIEGTLPQAN